MEQGGDMTDRELLVLAAESAFIPVIKKEIITSRIAAFREIKHTKRSVLWLDGVEWNPLTDDGDALRLSVKLSIHVRPWVYACEAEDSNGMSTGLIHASDCGGDVCAATRRAIVLAAAMIGKKMQ